MTSALLDPWPFQAAAEGSFEALNTLSKFDELIRRLQQLYQVRPGVVPFITVAEWDRLREVIGARYGRTSGYNARLNTARLFIRGSASHRSATPIPDPTRLTQNWKRALGDAVAGDDWRSPQIVIPESRQADWGAGDEASIQFDICDGVPSGEL